MEGNSTGRKTDLDRTDKLPIIADDKLVRIDRTRTSGGTDDTAALEKSLAQLREALGEETQRSRKLETRLDTQDQTIAKLQAAIEREAEQNSAVRTSAEAAKSQAAATRELIGKVQIALRSLHSRVVSLETYIAGRPEGWREMEQALHSKSIRIAEAESQLAEKIALLAQDLAADDIDSDETTDDDGSTEARADAPADPLLDAPAADATTDAASDAATDAATDAAQIMADELPTNDDSSLEPASQSSATPAETDESAIPELHADEEDDEDEAIGMPQRHSALVGGTADAPVAHSITKETVTIGRDPEADITIPAVSVSRHHAVVSRSGADIFIEDQASTNGVFVNGKRIQRQELSNGDEVVIGDSRFRFFSGELRD